MDIVSTTPIKTDSVATVEMAGITGVAFIQIEGGSQDAPALEVEEGRKFPVIKTKRSGLEALFDEAPKLIQRVIKLTEEATKLLNEGNQSALSETLENIRQLTSVLAGSSTRVAEIIDDSAVTAAEFRVAAKDVSAMANEARERTGPLLASAEDTLRTVNAEVKNLSGEANKMFDQLSTTAESLSKMSDELTGLIAENREPIRDFTSDGLYNFTRLIAEMRGLVSSLQRIAERLESDPSAYLFGGANQGYQAK
jgi:phospholipid/cholesterol/gamma-HCH transport system substrate-binding protein